MTFEELNNKYQEFKNKYNGKKTDYDGAYGAQCWDLAQRYFVEYLGVPAWVLSQSGLVSNMLDRDRHELDQYFDEIPLTNMCPGDVCIWEYGHIAIFDHWDGNQNWFFSQNPNPCQVMPIDRGGLHAFRLKGVHQPEPTPTVNEDKVKIEELQKELAEKEDIINNLSAGVTELTNTVIDKNKEIATLKEQLENRSTLIFTCTKTGNYQIKLYENEQLFIK